MAKSKNKPQLNRFEGPVGRTLDEGVVHEDCWDFANDRDQGGHRGVEGQGAASILPNRATQKKKQQLGRAIESGEW